MPKYWSVPEIAARVAELHGINLECARQKVYRARQSGALKTMKMQERIKNCRYLSSETQVEEYIARITPQPVDEPVEEKQPVA
jgi:hypothetical protein